MNLGSFAGGVAQGYQSGSRLKMARQEMEDTRNFRERTTKMAEEKHGWEQKDREAAEALKMEYDKLYQNFYPEGTTFGQDAAKDMQFTAATYGMSLKRGKINPKELLEYGKELKAMEQSELGQKFMRALNGGQGSPEFQELAAQYGLNGQAAKFDPKAMTLSDGKNTIDVRMPMMMLGLKEPLSMLESIREGDRKGEMHQADLKYRGAATSAQLASAGASSANAEQTRVETGNLRAGLPKNPSASRVDAVKTASDLLLRDDMFKMVPAPQKAAVNRYVEYLVTEGGLRPADAVLTALAEYQKQQTKGR